ncbi:hypothetical protein HYW41_02030 [Candidatus Daviesbacteria bacterium]|nr:hypothetical protein [Candidatus Daviesbacteria bacterium]
MYLIFLIFTTISISLYAFYPSFNLSLFGDFWLVIWRYERMVGQFSIGAWNYPTYFFTLFGSQDILNGFLFKIYHYNPSPYYITSYLFRLLASFSLYPLAFYLTRNTLASFFAVLFFSITTIGLETTDWVFHMPTYLLVLFFNLFLYFFLKSRDNYQIKWVVYFTLFFFATIVIYPIRSMSIVPFIVMIEIIWFLNHRTFEMLKKVVTRLTIISLIYLILLTQTNLFSSPHDWDNQTITNSTQALTNVTLTSFKAGYNLIQKGQVDFLLNPIAALGGMIIPNISVGNENKALSTFIGGLSIVIWFLLIILNRKSKILDALIISLIWTFFAFLIPWMRPEYLTSIFSTDQRYLILPAIGISILFASLISLGQSKKSRNVIIALLSLVLIMNIYSTRSYFSNLEQIRSQQLYDKIWSQLPEFKNIGKTERPLVFYFTGERRDIIHNVLEFGLPSKLQLIHNISDFKTVVTIDNFKDLISAVKDGKSLARFSVLPKPLPIENIYSFNLEGTDKLINTSEITRKNILKSLSPEGT